MRKYLLVILTLLVWPTGLAAKPLVVLVSIDGFKPDYLKRGNSPVLDGMVDRGASAKGLIPTFPSVTFPNHYSLVTGLSPDHHGIVNNVMFDPTVSGRPSPWRPAMRWQLPRGGTRGHRYGSPSVARANDPPQCSGPEAKRRSTGFSPMIGCPIPMR